MSTSVFLNGKFFGGEGQPPISEARLSAYDAGFQHAMGLFETMLGGVLRRGVEGSRSHGEMVETWILHLDEHMQRLDASARALGLSDQLRTGALGEVALETVRRSGLERARVRLTITGGDLSLLAGAQSGTQPSQPSQPPQPKPVDPTILIVAQPATAYPQAMFDRGVSVTLAESRANPLNSTEGHKTLNYWWRLRELQLAAAKGAGEALVLSITNHLCGGCVSNLLLVKGDVLVTPICRGEEEDVAGKGVKAVPSAALPGITRAWALEKAERLGLSVKKQMISVQDVLDADEAMLTNSSWGVLPVVRIEANQIGAGTPGRITRDLRDAWLGTLPDAIDDL